MMKFYPPYFYLGASGNVADGYGEKTDIVSSYFHSSFFKDLNSIFDLKKISVPSLLEEKHITTTLNSESFFR